MACFLGVLREQLLFDADLFQLSGNFMTLESRTFTNIIQFRDQELEYYIYAGGGD